MHCTSRIPLFGFALLLLGGCVSGRPVTPAGPDELLSSFVSALNHADTDALMRLFDPNATAFLPLDAAAAEVVGREAIGAAFAPFFYELRQQGVGPEYMHLVPKSVRTQRVGDALAIVTFDAGAGPVTSRRTLVIQKTPVGWRILHFHGSNIRKSATAAIGAPNASTHGTSRHGFSAGA
jgi:ketosteroid isomerase-like protein